MKEIYYVYVLQNITSGSFQIKFLSIKQNSPIKISGCTYSTRLIRLEQFEDKKDAEMRKEFFESKSGTLFLEKSVKNLFVEVL